MICVNLDHFQCLCPATPEEAFRQKAEQPELVPIAGGTEVMVLFNEGKLPGGSFQSLHALAPQWRYVRENADGGLEIGPLATYTDVRHHPAVGARYALLVESAAVTGALQIQNRGTLTGNIVNGSPAADTVPVLMVYDARVLLASVRGERSVPLSEFYTGYRKNVMERDELVAGIILPPRNEDVGNDYYRKVGTRAAQAISKVVFAAAGGREMPRLAIGSVGPMTLRLLRTEQALAGGADADQAAAILLEEIAPLDDIRSTRDYRLAVSRNIVKDYVGQL